MADLCENGNEHSGLTKGGKFFVWLNNYQILKENFIVWTQVKSYK
jgi:hypothetical protein